MSSELTDALNRILRWMEQHKPWLIEYLQPGLSISEIENLVKDLPIKLPSEVYELYQWRNGVTKGDLCTETARIFENWAFRPLQEALAASRGLYYRSNADESWGFLNPFSIFYFPGYPEEGIINIKTNQELYPVIFLDFEGGLGGVIKKYANLTSMMLTIAECYETGAYYHDSEAYERSYISSHPDNVRKIWQKYNSRLGELAVETLDFVFKQKKSIQEAPIELLEYLSDELVEFKDSRTVEILIHAIQTSSKQNCDLTLVTFFIKRAVEILGELGDTSAVPALIAILDLENDFCQIKDLRVTYSLIYYHNATESEVEEMEAWALKEIRQMAAWALGEIGDLRAAEPLSEALQDIDHDVRKVF